MKKLFFFLLFCSVLSCKQKIDYHRPEFKEVITRPLLHLGDTLDDLPGYLEVIGDFIVMRHRSLSNEQLFHIYNRYSGSYVLSFGGEGRAGGELRTPLNYVSTDFETTAVVAGNLNDVKLVFFYLDSLSNGKVSVRQEKLEQPLSYTHFFKFGKEHYLGCYATFSRFILYDRNVQPLDSCDYYPLTWKGAEQKAMKNYYFYASICGSKPDGTKFVNFTTVGPILEIYNVTDNKIEHSVTKYFAKPIYKKSGIPEWDENIYGPRACYLTDSYIYVLWNGKKDDFADIDRVSVFDWSGRPVKQYELGVNLFRLLIKEELGKGYVIYRDAELQYRLGCFDL